MFSLRKPDLVSDNHIVEAQKKDCPQYLKEMENIDFYDYQPLKKKQLEDLFDTVSSSYQNQITQVPKKLINDAKEQHISLYFIFLCIPEVLFKLFLSMFPTLIYTIKQ